MPVTDLENIVNAPSGTQSATDCLNKEETTGKVPKPMRVNLGRRA